MAIEPGWCLILGASSGFGAAAARSFARAGLDVAGVHLDRRATLPLAEAVVKDVEAAGRRARFWNANAADAGQREAIVAEFGALLRGGPRVRVLLHSLAFGTLKPLVAAEAKDAVSSVQVAMTLDVMATSLIGWTQALYGAGLFERGARVFAMTSEGGTRAIPTLWAGGHRQGGARSSRAAAGARTRACRDHRQRDLRGRHRHARGSQDSRPRAAARERAREESASTAHRAAATSRARWWRSASRAATGSPAT